MLNESPKNLNRLIFTSVFNGSYVTIAWCSCMQWQDDKKLNGIFSKPTWMSRCQKGKTSLGLDEATDDGVLGCSGISWSIRKQSAPHSRVQTDNHTKTTSLGFSIPDALPYAPLTVENQCQSTEGKLCMHWTWLKCSKFSKLPPVLQLLALRAEGNIILSSGDSMCSVCWLFQLDTVVVT